MQIPLFPLHTVLSPGLALPIHVFEERYRVLVRDCLDRSTPFGVVLIREGREVAPRGGRSLELSIAAVGTFAEIREASRYADGRWDLLTVGVGRFAIRAVQADAEPYLLADVEPLEDTLGDADAAEALVARVTRRFVDYLRLLQPREGEAVEPIDVQVEVEVPDSADEEDEPTGWAVPEPRTQADGREEHGGALRIPEDPSQLSFLLTGIVQVEAAQKQELLEAPSAGARLRGLDAVLDRELALLGARLAPYLVGERMTDRRTN